TTRAAMLGITLALTPAFLAAWKLEPWGPKAGFVTVKQFKQVASALPERSIVIDDTDLPLQCLVGSFKIWPPYRPTVGKMDSFYVLETVEGKDLASGSTAPAPSRFAQIRDRFDMRPVPGAPELKLAERRWGLLLAEPFHTRTVDLPIAPTATWLWVDLADSHHPQGLSLMWTTGSGKVLAHAPFARSPGWVGFQVPPDTRGLQLESENPMPSSPRTVEVSPDSPIRFPFESSRTPSDARLIPNPSGKGSVPYLKEFRDQATLRLPQIGHATGPSRWKGRVILRAAEKRTPGRIRVTSGEEEISSQTTYLPALSSGWKTWACEFVVGVEGPDEAPRAREVTLHQEPSELLLRLLEWEWTPITGP
ncbi:MAG: hypothetical protein KJT03_11045, partial [Verrucomicrobiae bacterium]|nr:hypothetical protein [Verrucomicrobiae bacterium]